MDQAGKALSAFNIIKLGINVYDINITHEEIRQAIATYLGPEYKWIVSIIVCYKCIFPTRPDMIKPMWDHNCTKGIILITSEVFLTSKESDHVVPEGTGFILYLSDGELKIEFKTYDMTKIYIIRYFLLIILLRVIF